VLIGRSVTAETGKQKAAAARLSNCPVAKLGRRLESYSIKSKTPADVQAAAMKSAIRIILKTQARCTLVHDALLPGQRGSTSFSSWHRLCANFRSLFARARPMKTNRRVIVTS